MNKRLLTVLIVIGVILLGVAWYFLSYTRVVNVDASNVESISVQSRDGSTVAKLSAGDSSIRLVSGRDYQLVYTGADDYADGTVELKRDQDTVSISPDYSFEYYQSLIADNLPKATKLLRDKYPGFSQYQVRNQKMYQRGDWFALTLEHRGSYNFNTDDLRVIFKRDGDSWSMATSPDILLDRYDSPDIPYEILLQVNRL